MWIATLEVQLHVPTTRWSRILTADGGTLPAGRQQCPQVGHSGEQRCAAIRPGQRLWHAPPRSGSPPASKPRCGSPGRMPRSLSADSHRCGRGHHRRSVWRPDTSSRTRTSACCGSRRGVVRTARGRAAAPRRRRDVPCRDPRIARRPRRSASRTAAFRRLPAVTPPVVTPPVRVPPVFPLARQRRYDTHPRGPAPRGSLR